jgi:hypothetical protein
MLKLILSQPNHTIEVPVFSRENEQPSLVDPFSASIKVQAPLLYIMAAQDPIHSLACDLVLEIENAINEFGSRTVICHFPHIDDEKLSYSIDHDETLLGIVTIQFQMKVLEQLLKFCENHHASRLIIYADDDYYDYLGIYREFISCGTHNQDECENTELAFTVDSQLIGDWKDYMNHINISFRQTLWQHQKGNFAIKNYLRKHPF